MNNFGAIIEQAEDNFEFHHPLWIPHKWAFLPKGSKRNSQSLHLHRDLDRLRCVFYQHSTLLEAATQRSTRLKSPRASAQTSRKFRQELTCAPSMKRTRSLKFWSEHRIAKNQKVVCSLHSKDCWLRETNLAQATRSRRSQMTASTSQWRQSD